MKIIYYKVPCTVKREEGQVILDIHEGKKEQLREEPISSAQENEVTSIAKKLSDSNELEKTVAKSILLKAETEKETYITWGILS
jgi:hypothetical protein